MKSYKFWSLFKQNKPTKSQSHHQYKEAMNYHLSVLVIVDIRQGRKVLRLSIKSYHT